MKGQSHETKRFYIKKKRTANTAGNYNMQTIALSKRKCILYTIRRQIKRHPLEITAAPGSLEENLQEPETYLETNSEIRSHFIGRKKLTPIDVFSGLPMKVEAKQKLNLTTSPGITGILRNKCSYRSTDSASNKETLKKKHKKKVTEAKDEELSDKYQKILNRLKSSAMNSINRELNETRQERFFERYKRTTTRYNKLLNMTCESIGRKPLDSVIPRATFYCEEVERKNVSEAAGRRPKTYGERHWYLSLRDCNKCKEKRHYIFPLGNTENGLWIRVTENPRKADTVTGTLRNRVRKEQRLGELYVEGKNAYEIEIEGFNKCSAPKVTIVNTNEDIEEGI